MRELLCKITMIDCGYSKNGISISANLDVIENKDNVDIDKNLYLIIGRIDFMIEGTEVTKPITELQLPLELAFLNIIEILTSYNINKLSEAIGKNIKLFIDDEGKMVKKDYVIK